MTVLRFRVLGVVEAVHSDHPVDIGHTRLRAVLAVLLVEANRVVSADQLIERAWDENPPRSRNVLYTYLSRLRTVLSADPGVAIHRRSGGYQLTVEQTAVDLHRFRNLIAEARCATEDDRRVALFDQALRLWRGTPFADLDTPWLATVRAAVEWERQDAQLDRTDAALRCGHHTHLLAELSTQATQHPFDERIAGQLMRAMAAAGRAADALATYQHTRQTLIDHLGMEPGPELRHLHERILAGDTDTATPTRTPPTSPAARPDVVVPHQLPAAARHFTGRHAELDTLLGLLPSPDAAGGTVVICAIDGMAGIGKTALAVHAAHQVVDQFPDGVLFTDLHGFTPDTQPTPPGQALERLLRGLGVPGPQIPSDLETRVGLYRSVLARRRVLIVLDNAAHETQLTPLLPATAGCAAIVTSRRHLASLDDATHLTLSVLDPAEAADLFRGLVGNRAVPDDTNIERIVALCGRLPLAIRITAARLRPAPAATPATLCVELEHALEGGQGLDWLSDGHRTITAALAVSVEHLTPGQQHALRLAGLHPGPDLEPYALAALANTTLDQARHLLEDLHAASLLDQPGNRRYTRHDLVAAYTQRLAAQLPEADRHAALDRLYDHYAATSARAMDLTRLWEPDHRPSPPATTTPTPSLPDREQAQAWLDTETDNLLAAAHHAATGHRADHTLHQSTTLHWHLRGRGHYTQAVLLHQQAQQHAQASADPATELEALNNLGHAHRLRGHYESAIDCFEQALDIARHTGHRVGGQSALRGLAVVHFAQGHYQPATDCYEQALDIARHTGHRVGEQSALHGLGNVHYAQGHYQPATDCYEQALDIARHTDHRNCQFEAHQGLGRVHHATHRHRNALHHHQTALQLAIDLDQPADQARAHDGLAHAHRALSNPDKARHHWQTVLQLLTGIGTDHTEDPDISTATIRAYLHALDNPPKIG